MTARGNDAMLDGLQRETFAYFANEANPANGLVVDRTRRGSPASISATGFALATYPIAVERRMMTRAQAVGRTLATLRFFAGSEQSQAAAATGYKGFYYHFLDARTGRRTWGCELSTIDTTWLLAGVLAAAQYFSGEAAGEREIRDLAAKLYRRADWVWALNGGSAVTHGWTPERGFLKYRWQGYCEALMLYVLGLGSPTHPLPASAYTAWAASYRWKRVYGHEFLYAGPLFIHQFSHLWIDFRGIRDAFMRDRKIDYFENSRRATYVQQEYAIRNPRRFDGYGEHCWGITASDGPGPAVRQVHGTRRRFYGYLARGVPYGPDDGTIAPWAAVSSLPFAPEIVLPTIRHFHRLRLKVANPYGFKATFNPTFPTGRSRARPWVSSCHVALNQGPIVMMIENYRTGLLWRVMRRCVPLVTGLRRAGFTGGWL